MAAADAVVADAEANYSKTRSTMERKWFILNQPLTFLHICILNFGVVVETFVEWNSLKILFSEV